MLDMACTDFFELQNQYYRDNKNNLIKSDRCIQATRNINGDRQITTKIYLPLDFKTFYRNGFNRISSIENNKAIDALDANGF